MILKEPHTLVSLTTNIKCASETITKYVSLFLQKGIIEEKRTK